MTVRELLQLIHCPMTGTLQATPGQASWCQGCGGVVRWPCLTRRVLDGECSVEAALDAMTDLRVAS